MLGSIMNQLRIESVLSDYTDPASADIKVPHSEKKRQYLGSCPGKLASCGSVVRLYSPRYDLHSFHDLFPIYISFLFL